MKNFYFKVYEEIETILLERGGGCGGAAPHPPFANPGTLGSVLLVLLLLLLLLLVVVVVVVVVVLVRQSRWVGEAAPPICEPNERLVVGCFHLKATVLRVGVFLFCCLGPHRPFTHLRVLLGLQLQSSGWGRGRVFF